MTNYFVNKSKELFSKGRFEKGEDAFTTIESKETPADLETTVATMRKNKALDLTPNETELFENVTRNFIRDNAKRLLGGKDEIKNLFESDLTKVLDRDLTEFIKDKMPRGYGEPYKNWVKSIAPELIKLADTRVGPDGVLMGDPYVFVNRGGKQFQGLFYDARGLTESGKVKRISVAKNKENPAWSWKQPSVEDVVDFLTVNRPGRPRVDSLRKPVARVIAKTIVKDYVNKTIRDSWAERAELKEGEKLSKDNPFNALSKKEFEKIQADNIFTTVAETILRHEDFVASRTKVPSFKNIEKALDKKYGPTPEMKKIISTENIIRSIVDDFRKQQPQAFDDWLTNIAQGKTTGEWLAKNTKYRRYFDPAIIRDQYEKALAGRDDVATFTSELNRLPDKVTVNGKVVDLADVKNRDYSLMSREVKVDGKKAYYEYDVDRIIDEYLPQVMESAKMFPTWLPKALGKTGAAQTLGLSDRGTGFGKLTSQERIYSKEQRIDNIKKQIKELQAKNKQDLSDKARTSLQEKIAKLESSLTNIDVEIGTPSFDAVTYEELAKRPEIKNQYENAVSNLGKDTHPVWKGIEERLDQLYKDDAIRKDLKKDFKDLSEAEAAEFINKKLNIGNNELRRDLYNAVQTTLDAYFKKGKTPQEIQDRAQFILQIKRNNTNATSGLDRMGVVVDAYYDPVGKDFSRETIKLEHLKPSVKQSMDVARAIIEGRWPKDAQKIMNEYKGVFAPKAKLDILDDIGKRTNTSNAARLILDLESLKNYKQTGTGKNYYDVILDNAAKDLRLTPRELRVIKSEAAADGVAEYLINGGDAAGKTTLRNTVDNVKERKGAYENNKSDLVFSKTKQPSISNQVESMNKADLALDFARKRDKEIKKIRIFDFDDTVARTDSKVFYTKPNLTGNPTPKRKAIFMIGGPGSGKTNIGKGLKLGRDGFKVVNQDIFIEAEKAKAGLPESERGYTPEQRSLRGKIGAAGTKAAKEKLAKYTEAGEGMVIDGTGASYNATMKKVKALEEQGYEVFMVHAKTSPKAAIERNKARKERSLPTFVVERTQKSVAENIGKYKKDFGNKFMEIDTETIEYGKPLPDSFVSEVKSRVYENERGILNAEEFAKQGDMLLGEGATYDFSDFNRVVDGRKGPLFDLMKTMKDAPGSRDMFILTARAPESAKAIQEFLKQMGIDLPLENIVGLGNSTGAAKGEWVMGKAAEGYNDFFFADDAMQNVRAVKEILDQVDVKSQVQIARSKTKDLSKEFNKLIQGSSGVEWYKDFSPAKAAVLGKSKGQKFFLPPSAEDFLGLIYTTLGKGKLGENQLKWYERNLINPYARGVQSLATERTHMMADFKKLKKELDVPKDLRKITESGFTKEQAVRVFLFENTGQEIPGISARDKAELLDIVNSDPKLKSFAQQIQMLLKGEQYAKPGQNWLAGTITTDLIDFLNTTKRNQYLEEFNTNVDQIYSTENLNKLEAIYGTRYRESMQNIIARMKSGRNRTSTGNRLADGVLDYINGAQGTIMFFNMRSALLQTISAANFINTSFNNPIAAGRAFANMPQYSKDFVKLMNSDYLVDRRNGLRLNISESEIADAAATSKNKAKAIINYIIEKGYLPTRFADSFAIASGGATWYRNRINNLVKQGVDVKTAEKQAYTEFIDISEKSQQSSDPSKISAQQASDAGRVFLQFVNTPMQYTRLQKRAFQDLANGRGDWKANISKILYYGVMQNLWFNAMQQGLFTLGFGDTDIDEVEEKKIVNTANGMADSLLRGLGLGGMTVSVLKNTLIDVYRRYLKEQDGKRPEYIDSWMKLLEFSPAIKSKFNKIKQAGYMFDNKTTRRKMKEKGFSLDNPAYKAGALVISATTNVPLDRAFLKYENLKHMVADDTEAWERVANFWGWPTWQLEDAAQRAARKKKEKMK
jgi:predicted kinase